MRNYVIIVAAGKGIRFGSAKQFQLLSGIPILIHSLMPFQKNNKIHAIIVVVPKKKIKAVKQLVTEFRLKKVKSIVSGGKRRQDSVYNGLSKVKGQKGIVIIHDGVRPIVNQSLINKGIKLCKKYKAVIFGTPIGDTVKEAKNHFILRTVPRKNLYLAQTPQFFDIQLIKKATKLAATVQEYTDEAAILEAQGIRVRLFEGQYNNIKVTRKEDLKLLEKIL